jgi:hypothetical protein
MYKRSVGIVISRGLEASRKYEADMRRINLQYAGIGASLVVFVITSLLFSHSIIANERLISFLSVLALLMIFEFINLLLHPFLGQLTHHAPVLMLAIMVGIAAVLIPFHHRLEQSITRRLVDKNKQIRLEAAKKVIGKIQNNTDR